MDDDLETTRQEWLKEQLAIAHQVVVPPDDWTDDGVIAQDENHRLVSLATRRHDKQRENTSSAALNSQYYGGVDVSFPRDGADPSVAVYVVMDRTTMQVVYQDYEYFDLTMPYIPSFLAFREIEPLQRLIEKQMASAPELTPGAILVDGNGILHPRRAGIACFVGVRSGIPTIGIGKTLYCEGGLSHSLVERGVARALDCARNALPTLAANADSDSNERILFARHPIGARHVPNADDVGGSIDERVCVQSMAPYCRGLAIPLDAQQQTNGDDTGERILACALVGHGGRVSGRGNRCTTIGGTKNALFVTIYCF